MFSDIKLRSCIPVLKALWFDIGMISMSDMNTTEMIKWLLNQTIYGGFEPFLSFVSYKNQYNYLNHMKKLFDQYGEGTPSLWEDDDMLY